jgi:hypothetical protein
LTAPKLLHVVYRHGPAGWTASVRELRRCRSKGRTIRAARRALRDALSRVLEDGHAPDLVEDVRLPGAARRLLVLHWKARRRVEREQGRASAAEREAAQALLALRLNARDLCDLLGVSLTRLRVVGAAGRSASRASGAASGAPGERR